MSLLALWHTWHPCESKKTPSTPLLHRFLIFLRLRVISSGFDWVIASSHTCRSLWLQFFCYSWWLSSPRWLGSAEEYWHKLMIVRGYLPTIVRGLVPFAMESRKVTLVDCARHWATSLVGRFLQSPTVDEICATPLSRRTTECWLTQQGLACRQAYEPREKNLCVHLLWLIEFLLVIGLHYIDWFTCLYTAV